MHFYPLYFVYPFVCPPVYPPIFYTFYASSHLPHPIPPLRKFPTLPILRITLHTHIQYYAIHILCVLSASHPYLCIHIIRHTSISPLHISHLQTSGSHHLISSSRYNLSLFYLTSCAIRFSLLIPLDLLPPASVPFCPPLSPHHISCIIFHIRLCIIYTTYYA